MGKKFLSLCSFLFFTAVFAGMSRSQPYFMAENDLINNADVIVVIQVTGAKNAEAKDHLGYLQEVTARVQKVIKGNPGGQITILAKEKSRHAQSNYENKTRYLVFLRRIKDFYVTLNYDSGQFEISKEDRIGWFKSEASLDKKPSALKDALAEIQQRIQGPKPEPGPSASSSVKGQSAKSKSVKPAAKKAKASQASKASAAKAINSSKPESRPTAE